MTNCKINANMMVEVFSSSDKSNWFGYYTLSPLNEDGTKLLSHKTDFDGRNKTSGERCVIGYYDLHNKVFTSITETTAFNWQQGALLQWYYEDDNEYLICNTFRDGAYKSVIYDTYGTEVRVIDFPIYQVISDMNMAFSIDFRRCDWVRAYSYDLLMDNEWNGDIISNEGIYSVDLKKNEKKMILSIHDIVSYEYDEEFLGKKHWIEHLIINEDAELIMFYHRFSLGDGYKTRILVCDYNGDIVYCNNEWKDINFTHSNWRGNHEIVTFGVKNRRAGELYSNIIKIDNFLIKLLKWGYRKFISPLISNETYNRIAVNSTYYIFNIKTNESFKVAKDELLYDGHPTFLDNEMTMLSDTYAKENGYRDLYLYDLSRDEYVWLGSFYSPFNDVGYRCDLHPRIFYDQGLLVIDSAHSGRHQIYVYKLKKEISNI